MNEKLVLPRFDVPRDSTRIAMRMLWAMGGVVVLATLVLGSGHVAPPALEIATAEEAAAKAAAKVAAAKAAELKAAQPKPVVADPLAKVADKTGAPSPGRGLDGRPPDDDARDGDAVRGRRPRRWRRPPPSSPQRQVDQPVALGRARAVLPG